MKIRQHIIEGCLCKFNTEWHDGTKVLPGAVIDQNGKNIPIVALTFNDQQIIGYIVLDMRSDGVYYKGAFFDFADVEEIIDQIIQGNYRLGLYGNDLQMNNHIISRLHIAGAIIGKTWDNASYIEKVDGVYIEKPLNREIKLEKDGAMNKRDFRIACGSVARYWGSRMPMMTMEECGELIQAISKFERSGRKPDSEEYKNLVDELGDMTISLMALQLHYWDLTGRNEKKIDTLVNGRIAKKLNKKYPMLNRDEEEEEE